MYCLQSVRDIYVLSAVSTWYIYVLSIVKRSAVSPMRHYVWRHLSQSNVSTSVRPPTATQYQYQRLNHFRIFMKFDSALLYKLSHGVIFLKIGQLINFI
jgi:hypothetical protein